MKRFIMRVVADENGILREIHCPDHTAASLLLSWYAVEAPNQLKGVIKILKVRR